jgi:hypothetical protein
MTHILEVFYNWSFLIGALAGFLLMRLYCRLYDRRHGGHTSISRIWTAGLITLAVLGYVLLTAQRAADQTVRVAQAQKNCQNDINGVIKDRAGYTERGNVLNKRRQDLLDQLNEASAEWLNQLINPPPEIAAMVISDPRRQDYGLGVSRAYFEHAKEIRDKIDKTRDDQDQLAKDLAAHPIPALCR